MYSVHNSTSEDLSTSEEARRKVTTWLDDIAMNHSRQDYLSKMSKEVDHKNPSRQRVKTNRTIDKMWSQSFKGQRG